MNFKEKCVNMSHGITLIVLVITIIVLMILAGVSFSMIMGDDGIISKAARAKEEAIIGEEKEQVEAAYSGAESNELKPNVTIVSTDIQSELDKNGVKANATGEGVISVTFQDTGHVYRILTSGKIVGPITSEIIENWTIDFAIGTRTLKTTAVSVTVNNLKSENGQLTYKYYIKKATESDDYYVLKYEGTSNTYIYENVYNTQSYLLKVEVMDEIGNKRVATQTAGVHCFLAGTKILSESGMKNIEEIEIGEKVYSINIDNNQKELKEVLAIFEGESNEVYELTIGDEVVKTTPKHQFYIVDKGWVRACDIQEGDRIVAKDNSDLIINNIEYKYYEEPVKVYNLTVEGYHNYLITPYEMLVHNAGSPSS